MSYHLITTADERSWKFDTPIVFLGEWCRVYDRRDVWDELDAVVPPPYGLEKSNKDLDYIEAQKIEAILFPILCDRLNKYHEKQYSGRFWKILLGHWFQRYINVIINRVRTLQQCMKCFELTTTTFLTNENDILAASTSLEGLYFFGSDRFNNLLYVELMKILEVDIIIEEFFIDSPFPVSKKEPKNNINKRLKNIVEGVIKIIKKIITRKKDALIMKSYLPRVEVIKLQLLLKQFPQFHTSLSFNSTRPIDKIVREKISKEIKIEDNNELLNIASSLVFKLLPSCYLEGFLELLEVSEKNIWPSKPKFIFTSNSFDFDEGFKVWVGNKVEAGYKYIVGQHGNNYGTSRYINPSIEEQTADKFITWGWQDRLLQHTPAFILKNPYITKSCEYYNPKGGLLLIEFPKDDNLFFSWDITYEYIEYFSEQQQFISKLSGKIKKNITIRLHPTSDLMSWSDKERWDEFDSTLYVDDGKDSLKAIIKKQRLIVHSYDSTGILETLSKNIPTIAFWKNDFDHLRDNAIPYYKLLLDVGIIHLTVDSVTSMINEIWDDIEGWWMKKDVQNARKLFCEKYAKTVEEPIQYLKNILEDE